MSDAIVSRLGQVNQSGGSFANDSALFLKVFGGEVLTAFARNTVTMDKHMVRTINSGKSAQFPVMGRTTASYHEPGQQLLGGKFNHAERTITIDGLLVAQAFIANIDELKNHYDVRGPYAQQLGEALAQQMDKHVLQQGVLTARATAAVTDGDAGTVIGTNTSGAPASADYLLDGEDLADAIYMAAEAMDGKYVPKEGRYAFVKPQQYYKLVRATRNINKDWGGEGSFAAGSIVRIADIPIIMTNNLPRTNITTGVDAGQDQGSGAKYAGDFSNTAALVMHTSAVGTLKLQDLALESEYQISRQGTLMVAKYAVGHDKLRPEAAVEIRNAAV